jgi:hypothetical protein
VVAFLMPVAVYPICRVTAVDPSISAFWQHLLALPFWHSGPPWFLWVLLIFDVAAAAMFEFARHWGEALGRRNADPRAYLAGLLVASALACTAGDCLHALGGGKSGPSRFSSAGRCIMRCIFSRASGRAASSAG